MDQFGGSAAAFSLRNLSSSYRGPLVRVRRSSDNAETDIGGTFSGDLDVNSLLAFTGGQNLVPQSEDFSAGVWVKALAAVTANATIDPNGSLTADKLTESAATGIHRADQTLSLDLLTTQCTVSFYAKAAERRYLNVGVIFTTSAFDNFGIVVDLVTGNIISNTITAFSLISNSTSTNVGNGWWRFSFTGTNRRSGSNLLSFVLFDSPTGFSYAGVAGSGVYVWGAQITTGSVLQPYIPTTTAAINGANAFVTKWYDQSGIGDNLLLQSQTFENAYWSKNLLTASADVITAPDGTLTADSISETAANGDHYVGLVGTGLTLSNQPYTFSCYYKANQRTWAVLSMFNGTNSLNAWFDLQNGVVGTVQSGATATIQNVGNGWYRCSITRVMTLANNNFIGIGVAPSDNIAQYLGVVGQGVYIWGAQLSLGSELLRYQPTTTAIAPKRDAIQTTAASQPRIVNAGSVESENGKPAVYNTTATSMTMPSMSLLNFTILWVSRRENEAVTGSIVLAGSNADYAGDDVDNQGNPLAYAQTTLVGTSRSNALPSGLETTHHITYINRRGTQAVGQFNNSENNYNNTTSTISLLLNGIANYGGNYNYLGDLQEILIYSDDRSANRSPISSNLNSYYQIYWQGNGTALLDSFSGASAAYSLRNLSSAYTGPLIRVRRSNDNAERDIYGTFRGDLDLAALTSFVGANSGFVTTWYDQSGLGRNATQATAASQPRIVNAGAVDTEGGKPSINFIGGSAVLISNGSITGGSFTSFAVYRHQSTTNQNAYTLYSGGLYTQIVDFQANFSFIRTSDNTITSYNSGTSIITRQLRSFTYQNSFLFSDYRNNSLVYSNNLGLPAYVPNSLRMAEYDPSIGQDVILQELIFFATDRSTAMTAIETNINNYYKIY